MKISNTDIARFHSFIQFPSNQNGCWTWKGGKARRDNRARFWVDGETRTAARVSFTIYRGHIKDGLWVLHKCDNPDCVNPGHLFLGTNQDNMLDMVNKNRRSYKGESAPNHKLSSKDVIKIRKMLDDGIKQKDIASIYGVCPSSISHIARNKTFVEVE